MKRYEFQHPNQLHGQRGEQQMVLLMTLRQEYKIVKSNNIYRFYRVYNYFPHFISSGTY